MNDLLVVNKQSNPNNDFVKPTTPFKNQVVKEAEGGKVSTLASAQSHNISVSTSVLQVPSNNLPK